MSNEVSDETLIQKQQEQTAVEAPQIVKPNFELVSQVQPGSMPQPNFAIVQPQAAPEPEPAPLPVQPNLDIFAQLPVNRQFIQEKINPEDLREIVRTQVSTSPIELEALPQPRSTFTGLKSVSAKAAEDEAEAEVECNKEVKTQLKNNLRSAVQQQQQKAQPAEKPFFTRIAEALKLKRDH